MSETSDNRHLTTPYCQGNGIDIGSGGSPVVPWAIQIDLPEAEFLNYGHGFSVEIPIQWRGDGCQLPFKDAVLDFVYSSHLLEDFLDWRPVLTEWVRVLKPGGHLVILLPDKEIFNACVRAGGSGNASHKHESYAGELSSVIGSYGSFEVITDRLVSSHPMDYNILFVAKKTA